MDRIVALIQMSCQTTSYIYYLILSNVSSQWCRAGLDLTKIMLDKGQITPALARPILSALKGVSKEDPFGIISSVESDRAAECCMSCILATRAPTRAPASCTT